MRLQRKKAEAPQKRRRLLVNVTNACERACACHGGLGVRSGGGNVKATGRVRGRAAGGREVEVCVAEEFLEREAVVLGRRFSVCVSAWWSQLGAFICWWGGKGQIRAGVRTDWRRSKISQPPAGQSFVMQ